MPHNLCDFCAFSRRRKYLILWISLVIYLFYKSFTFYLNGRQFFYLRRMLGLGLCVSRGTATVLNLCCALVLLPLCKKLNQLLYRILSKICPGLFFFWLESAKSFHMTVAITLVIFGVIHSVSHFVNLWNFSRSYDEVREEINLARYKNESPLLLLMSVAGVTGISMLIIVISMGLTSTRIVRRRIYNAFWYTHQLYLPFMVLLMIHPLSGVLKEEIVDENRYRTDIPTINVSGWNVTHDFPKFAAIQSMTWLWMTLPLSCFFMDLLWRIFTRNLAKVRILKVSHMAGRTISLTLSTPHREFVCRAGQYVLAQCPNVSVMEWHPFTVVEIPSKSQRRFTIWIKVKGDWTETLEKMIKERGPNNLSVLIDGPFSSPMEGISSSEISICIAAGVGITPFVSVLKDMLMKPRNKLPGRVHLIWIVRHEGELTWIANLATDTIIQLRNNNRLDRLQIELYVTNSNNNIENRENNEKSHLIVLNESGNLIHVVNNEEKPLNTSKNGYLSKEKKMENMNNPTIDTDIRMEKNYSNSDERKCLLTPINKRSACEESVSDVRGLNNMENMNNEFEIAKKYPLLGCRVRRGRPHWDRVFGYWAHLYPGHHINLYCCGPKKLVKLLRNKCKYSSRHTKTKLTFIHEAFS
ncbi:unnamed protein product, partial [Brenthis ino]